jgi:hypothetical protein
MILSNNLKRKADSKKNLSTIFNYFLKKRTFLFFYHIYYYNIFN